MLMRVSCPPRCAGLSPPTRLTAWSCGVLLLGVDKPFPLVLTGLQTDFIKHHHEKLPGPLL